MAKLDVAAKTKYQMYLMHEIVPLKPNSNEYAKVDFNLGNEGSKVRLIGDKILDIQIDKQKQTIVERVIDSPARTQVDHALDAIFIYLEGLDSDSDDVNVLEPLAAAYVAAREKAIVQGASAAAASALAPAPADVDLPGPTRMSESDRRATQAIGSRPSHLRAAADPDAVASASAGVAAPALTSASGAAAPQPLQIGSAVLGVAGAWPADDSDDEEADASHGVPFAPTARAQRNQGQRVPLMQAQAAPLDPMTDTQRRNALRKETTIENKAFREYQGRMRTKFADRFKTMVSDFNNADRASDALQEADVLSELADQRKAHRGFISDETDLSEGAGKFKDIGFRKGLWRAMFYWHYAPDETPGWQKGISMAATVLLGLPFLAAYPLMYLFDKTLGDGIRLRGIDNAEVQRLRGVDNADVQRRGAGKITSRILLGLFLPLLIGAVAGAAGGPVGLIVGAVLGALVAYSGLGVWLSKKFIEPFFSWVTNEYGLSKVEADAVKALGLDPELIEAAINTLNDIQSHLRHHLGELPKEAAEKYAEAEGALRQGNLHPFLAIVNAGLSDDKAHLTHVDFLSKDRWLDAEALKKANATPTAAAQQQQLQSQSAATVVVAPSAQQPVIAPRAQPQQLSASVGRPALTGFAALVASDASRATPGPQGHAATAGGGRADITSAPSRRLPYSMTGASGPVPAWATPPAWPSATSAAAAISAPALGVSSLVVTSAAAPQPAPAAAAGAPSSQSAAATRPPINLAQIDEWAIASVEATAAARRSPGVSGK